VLRIDLSSGKAVTERIDPEMLREWVGGVGYAARLLYDELVAGVDPLGGGNKLVFATGPLTGTGAPGSGFAEVCCKSPLTGIWGESKCGGEWGGALKRAGYDFLVVEGKARGPSFVVIDGERVEMRPGEDLRGRTTSAKEKALKEEVLKDGEFEVLTIGPAGENLVKFANIMLGGRSFGRGGAGAVMGAKNLLAVAVKGSGNVAVARPGEFSQACRAGYRKVLAVAGKEGMAEDGTTGDLVACDASGDIPTKNWRANSWGMGETLYRHFKEHNLAGASACYRGCVLRCGRIAGVESGRWATPRHEGNEYESIAAFTFFVMNEDMDAAVHADYLCNEYGLDTISTGAAIAFAMDCYGEGIIGAEEVGGLDLSWGNAGAMIELVKRIACREGIGRVLAQGVRRASEQIGGGSDRLAIHVKGLEGPAHDARSGKALAVTYALSNRGMCHIHPLEGMAYDSQKKDFGLVPYGIPDPEAVDRFAEEGKGTIARTLQDFGMLPDILGICKFYVYNGLGPAELAGMVSALTGWDMDGDGLLALGGRVYDLQRRFNAREGIGKADDRLPERCLQRPESGTYASVRECEIKDLGRMVEECYRARGWDKTTGLPREGKTSRP
jgi:aldehyde:ferredoxin oxidoreductase